LANFAVSNNVDDEEFESEEKTGKLPEIGPHFANFWGLGDAPRSPVRLRIRPVFGLRPNLRLNFRLGPNFQHKIKFGLNFGLRLNFGVSL